MQETDRQVVLRAFASYYETADFMIPGLEQREFGIGNIRKIEARHLSFPNLQAFRAYLATNTPLFVSHSTSYYGFPGATPIQKKVWKGADLVFDLDIHAEGKYGVYPLLGRVKEDLLRLVKDFIMNDFGCRDVLVAFSGNRGYHVHVRDKAFLQLGGEERRELVDYVMGNGLDYRNFFDTPKKQLLGPRPDEGGYRGRFAQAVIRTLDNSPALISRKYSKPEERAFFMSGIAEGNWSRTFLKFNDLKERLGPVAGNLGIHSVNTDAGVTQDLSKLIRVPNSIHGETGLVARVIDPGAVEKFEPLRDAFMPVSGPQQGSGAFKIRFLEDVPALEMMGGTIGPFKKGDEKELQRQLALFFVCKESATLIA